MEENAEDLLKEVIQHFDRLLNAPETPDLPEKLSGLEKVVAIHSSMSALREVLFDFSRGDLSKSIAFRGFSAGCLKALQAHLRHIVWQVQQVENGDFTQRADFLGEFSTSFNAMVIQLDTILTTLRQKEEVLLQLTRSLQQEVELRKSAMNALSQSEAKFKYLAEHDPLTESLNRRSFFSHVIPAVQNAVLAKESCCFGLLDIDRFKSFNDTYGHLGGDAALKHVVAVATAQLRNGDILGRYGGEEFIFFFSGAELDQGFNAADRIRKAIESSPVQLESGQSVQVTASMGVSVVLPEWKGERDAHFVEQIIKAADDALYVSKATGRNRVTKAPFVQPGGDVVPEAE